MQRLLHPRLMLQQAVLQPHHPAALLSQLLLQAVLRHLLELDCRVQHSQVLQLLLLVLLPLQQHHRRRGKGWLCRLQHLLRQLRQRWRRQVRMCLLLQQRLLLLWCMHRIMLWRLLLLLLLLHIWHNLRWAWLRLLHLLLLHRLRMLMLLMRQLLIAYGL
jgi:hypothetical protein